MVRYVSPYSRGRIYWLRASGRREIFFHARRILRQYVKIYLLEGLCSQTASGNIACPPTFDTIIQTPNTLVLIDLKDDIVVFLRKLKKNLCRLCEINQKCSLLRPPCMQHREVCSDWCLYHQGWLRGTKFLKCRRHAQILQCLQRLG